jgi:hypothetical protein
MSPYMPSDFAATNLAIFRGQDPVASCGSPGWSSGMQSTTSAARCPPI